MRYTNKPPLVVNHRRSCKRVCVCDLFIIMADGKGKHQVRPIKDDVYQVMLHGKQQNCSSNRSAYRLLKKYKVEDRKCPVTGQVCKKVVSNFIFIIERSYSTGYFCIFPALIRYQCTRFEMCFNLFPPVHGPVE